MIAEMKYYNVPDPYGKSSSHYKDHYLCLWGVTGDEVIRHWGWDDLAANDHRYEEIILPAFREYEESVFASPSNGGLFQLIYLFG